MERASQRLKWRALEKCKKYHLPKTFLGCIPQTNTYHGVCKLWCIKKAVTLHSFLVFYSYGVVFEVYNIDKCENEVHFQ
jgi:hypothetical protein